MSHLGRVRGVLLWALEFLVLLNVSKFGDTPPSTLNPKPQGFRVVLGVLGLREP